MFLDIEIIFTIKCNLSFYLELVSFCYFGILGVNLKVHPINNSNQFYVPLMRMNSIHFYVISVAKHCIQTFIVYHKTFKHTEKCKSNWICQFLQNISRFKFFVCLFHGFFTSGNYCQKHVFVSGRRDITSQLQFRYTIWLM